MLFYRPLPAQQRCEVMHAATLLNVTMFVAIQPPECPLPRLLLTDFDRSNVCLLGTCCCAGFCMTPSPWSSEVKHRRNMFLGMSLSAVFHFLSGTLGICKSHIDKAVHVNGNDGFAAAGS